MSFDFSQVILVNQNQNRYIHMGYLIVIKHFIYEFLLKIIYYIIKIYLFEIFNLSN
jgi:hypothetical protein